MIDFAKIEIFGLSQDVWTSSKYLDFKQEVSLKTGELAKCKIATYLGMKFKISDSGRMFLQGSLHKYYNAFIRKYAPNQTTDEDKIKGFNGNDFNYTQLKFVINDLNKKFSMTATNHRILNLEFGLNIQHDFITTEILKSLMLHNGKTFETRYQSNYKQFQHQRYLIKCYDKQWQYGMPNKALRLECKYMKMKDINALEIISLFDLLKLDKLDILKRLLIKQFNLILLYDYTIELSKLASKEISQVQNYSNPNYWSSLKPNRRHRPKQKYLEIEQKHSFHLKDKLEVDLKSKWIELNVHCATYYKIKSMCNN